MDPPRVGGGVDATAWTGGSNRQADWRTRPTSTMARRPTEFKSDSMIKRHACAGLAEHRHLGPNENTSKITLTAWINWIRLYMEEHGLDTVLRVYTPLRDGAPETYLLEEWGTVRSDAIDAWIGSLENGVPSTPSTLIAQQAAYAAYNNLPPPVAIHPVCPYNTDNLQWSGKAIMASVTLELWEGLEKTIGTDPTGPEAFLEVIRKLQQMNSAASQTLVEELKEISFIKEPGQDVDAFGDPVVELCGRISRLGAEPNNLSVVAATTLIEYDVLDFKLKALDLHGRAIER